MTATLWIAVAILGGLGAVARFLIDGLISTAIGQEVPYGTFFINISGAFLLGLLSGAALSGSASLLSETAALGSYTTFSTWLLETHRLREEGEFAQAIANTLISLLVGLGAVALGRVIGVHL
jgi:CrcB protein